MVAWIARGSTQRLDHLLGGGKVGTADAERNHIQPSGIHLRHFAKLA